uniref:Uncharacterized protein n=1 Tax=Plectus sambesii TaxID=2011161 RepID=A0A914XK99_9BILA
MSNISIPGFPPSSTDYFEAISPTIRALTIVAIVLALITVVLSGLHIRSIVKFVSVEYRRHLMLWMSLVLPICAICSAIGVSVPRSVAVVESFSMIYFMSSLLAFVCLLEHLFGGRAKMANQLMERKSDIVLRSPPICCFPCMPRLAPTEANIYKIEWLVLQAPVVRFIVLFISLIVGLNNAGVRRANPLYAVINIITAISTISAVYGCNVLTRASQQALQQYNIRRLFVLVQILLIFINLQEAIFEFLGQLDVIPSDAMMSANYRAKIYHHLLFTLEVLVVALLTTLFFRPSKNHMFDMSGASVTS